MTQNTLQHPTRTFFTEFMNFLDLFKGTKKSGREDRLKQLEAASFRQDEQDEDAVLDRIKIKEEPPPAPEPEAGISPPPEEEEPALPEPGGIYAMQERNGGLHRLVKVVHAEDGFVHVIRYAGRFLKIPELLSTQELNMEIDPIDSSFGADHLPIPLDSFRANSTWLQDSPLEESDFSGWRLYVDSVYDCLSENAPDWLRKAGSYAAWRDDRNAMAVLADRYLLGADLPRDSKKALYWLNRIVQQGIGIIQPGEPVREEYQILTGGIYLWTEKDGSHAVGRVALKDRHGIQFLICPNRFERLPKKLNLVKLLEETGRNVAHASLTADSFISCDMTFMGLLPVTLTELHCYRIHLQAMCGETEFQPSTFELLLRRAEAGEVEAQHEAAQVYLAGDPAWEVAQDIAESVRWLTEAANLGHGPSAFALARICRNGAGNTVVPDSQLSFEWLLYAARLDHGPAQTEAAACCLQGLGCPQNPALAHAWYSLAASRNNGLTAEQKQQAKAKRQELDADMTAAQRAKAREYLRQMQESLQA
ncbi:Sel1 repeat-containing protein [Candidatus Electronema halotolerans]